MKVELPLEQFKRAISAVKHGCLTNDTRPILKYVHISEKDGKLAFFSCDGFCAYRYLVKAEVPKGFEAFLLPAPFHFSKRCKDGFVNISVEQGVTTVSAPTEYGSQSYSFMCPSGSPLNEDKIMTPAADLVGQHYNPALLASACSAYKGFSSFNVAHSSAPSYQPAYLLAEESDVMLEAIVLPQRVFNEKDNH